MPSMTDIGHLALLVALVSGVGAWLRPAANCLRTPGFKWHSRPISACCKRFGPTDDLTVLRDRVIGIVLGNVC